MNFLKEFYIGIQSYFEALLFIKKHRLYYFIIFPMFMMLMIYYSGSVLKSNVYVKDVDTMNDIIWYLIRLFSEISISFVFIHFSKYLMVAILSPLLTFLSQKTETILIKNKYKFSYQQFKKDINRALKIVVRNLFWYYLIYMFFYLITYFFWNNPEQSPFYYMSYIVLSYYYGFSFIDYVNERRKLSVKESVLFVRQHAGLAIGLGTLYSLMILLPVDIGTIFGDVGKENTTINNLSLIFLHFLFWLIASLAPILACVSSTLAMNKIVNLKK